MRPGGATSSRPAGFALRGIGRAQDLYTLDPGTSRRIEAAAGGYARYLKG